MRLSLCRREVHEDRVARWGWSSHFSLLSLRLDWLKSKIILRVALSHRLLVKPEPADECPLILTYALFWKELSLVNTLPAWNIVNILSCLWKEPLHMVVMFSILGFVALLDNMQFPLLVWLVVVLLKNIKVRGLYRVLFDEFVPIVCFRCW